jgi:hypothetical protein
MSNRAASAQPETTSAIYYVRASTILPPKLLHNQPDLATLLSSHDLVRSAVKPS